MTAGAGEAYAGAGGLDFFRGYRVDITVWKKLWIMCKTQWRRAFCGVTTPLWKKMRNNIFSKKGRAQRERTGKAALRGEYLNI